MRVAEAGHPERPALDVGRLDLKVRGDRPRRSEWAIAVGGFAFTAAVMISFVAIGGWSFPGGDAFIWDRAGDQVRAGISPYLGPPGSGSFFYAPPWAIAFALVSWLPVPVVGVAILVAELVALRFVAGSWIRAGYIAWIPLVPLELIGSNWNLVMAAAIAAAMRGDPRAAVVMTAAKLSPILAVDPRTWRLAIPIVAILVAITLPWASLWIDWGRRMVESYGLNIAPGAQLLIPFAPRFAVALALLAVRRPWSRGLAAIVAVPTIYWVSFLLLLARIPRRPSNDSSSSTPRRADGE
jgi:hypothetical protein